MNVEANKDRPKRKPQSAHRVAANTGQPRRKPMAFGWGADLNHREREAVKERIALLAGIAMAAIVVIALGWGWYQDNIAHPAAVQAENNKPVAQVGSYTVRMGFFKRFEKFQQTQTNNQLSTVQQYVSQIQSLPKKSAKDQALLAQYQQQQSQLQQQLASLPSQSLSSLIADQVVLQRSGTAGVPNTPKASAAAWAAEVKAATGPKHLEAFIQQNGLTDSEMRMLLTAQYLQTKVAARVAAHVPHIQPEVRASHILIPSSHKALAEQVLAKVEHGANFAALAKKYSKDTSSAAKGGDLGYFAHGTMVAPFDKAAFAMQPGQVKLVKSQFGWHIIKVTGRKQVHLSAAQYSQAQQQAFSTWLSTQQSDLHIERFVQPAALPNPVNSTTSPGLVGQQPGAIPGSSQGQTTGSQPVPVAKSATGKKK